MLISTQYVVFPLHVESKEHKVHAYSVQVYIIWALVRHVPSSTLV